jgi:hypothetical protein
MGYDLDFFIKIIYKDQKEVHTSTILNKYKQKEQRKYHLQKSQLKNETVDMEMRH